MKNAEKTLKNMKKCGRDFPWGQKSAGLLQIEFLRYHRFKSFFTNFCENEIMAVSNSMIFYLSFCESIYLKKNINIFLKLFLMIYDPIEVEKNCLGLQLKRIKSSNSPKKTKDKLFLYYFFIVFRKGKQSE